MERHVLAHELGHAILHPKTNITYLESNTFYSKERFEIAAELLIEDSLFDEYKHHTIEEMAAMENLPIELIKIKLNYI